MTRAVLIFHGQVLLGSVLSGLAAYVSVRFLNRYVVNNSLRPFACYCLIAGAVSLVACPAARGTTEEFRMSENGVEAVSARPARRTTVPGGTGYAVRVTAGSRVSVVNTLGQQVVDTWAIGLGGGTVLSMSHTRLATSHVVPRVGDVLVDDRRQPMLAIVADTSGGAHDTLIAACDPQRYRALGADEGHANCSDNYQAAVSAAGLEPRSTPDPLNLFMAVPVATDGSLSLDPSAAPAGSEVLFEALQDLLLVVSACPQDMVPISGTTSPPRQIDLYTE